MSENPKYTLLQEGEIIQKEDEAASFSGDLLWKKTGAAGNVKPEGMLYRRRIDNPRHVDINTKTPYKEDKMKEDGASTPQIKNRWDLVLQTHTVTGINAMHSAPRVSVMEPSLLYLKTETAVITFPKAAFILLVINQDTDSQSLTYVEN